MEFIHSTIVQDAAVVAGATYTFDLPVNPLSHVFVTLPYIRTAAGTNALPAIANTINLLTRIEVLYKGSAIFSMNGWDAVAAGLYIAGFESWGVNYAGIIAEEASFTWCIPLGRDMYNPNECFPRSTRGELQLQLTFLTPFVDVTSTVLQVETVELPEASPTRFLRMTTLAATIPAAGEYDIDLPIGNMISDLVLWGAVHPVGAAKLASLTYLQLLVDNQRRYYSHTNYETHHNMAGRLRTPPGYWWGHSHFAAAGIGISQNIASDHLLACYSHLPFDIFHNGDFGLDTAGKSDVTLRIGSDVVGATTVRVIPCEIVAVGAGV
jgi:hypothetical protein